MKEPRSHTPIMFHPAAVGVDGRVNLFVGNVSTHVFACGDCRTQTHVMFLHAPSFARITTYLVLDFIASNFAYYYPKP